MNKPVPSPRTASSIMHLYSSRGQGLQAAAQTVQSTQLFRRSQSQIFRLRVARKSLPEHALRSLARSNGPRDSAGLAPSPSHGRTPLRPPGAASTAGLLGLSSTPFLIKCFLGAPEALLSAHLAPLLFSEVESAATEKTGSVGDKGGPGRRAGPLRQDVFFSRLAAGLQRDGARRRRPGGALRAILRTGGGTATPHGDGGLLPGAVGWHSQLPQREDALSARGDTEVRPGGAEGTGQSAQAPGGMTGPPLESQS